MGQVMGGLRLASQENQDGLAIWRPSMADTGEGNPVEGGSARSATETPAPQTRTMYGSETAQQSSLGWQPQPARHVSWHERQLGERGSGGSMAVSDEGAAVGGQVSTPQLRFTPANGTYGSAEELPGRQAGRLESASRVSWKTPAPGARGSGAGMAVDDAATDVSVSGGTPALRLKGACATPLRRQPC